MKQRLYLRQLAIGSVLWASLTSAVRSQASPARLFVDAEPTCATDTAIAARVATRSQKLAFAADGGGPQLRVRIERTAAGAVDAALWIAIDGRSSERRLHAASCAEAVDAVALLITLALDPAAATRAQTPRSKPAPAAPSTPAPPSAAEAPPSAASLDAGPSPAPPPAPVATGSPREPEREPAKGAPAEFSFAAHLEGRGLFGPAPAMLTGAGIAVLVSWERDSVLTPALGLAASHSWLGPVETAGGRASFQLQLVRLDACILRVRFGPAALRGCGTGAIGSYHARGSDTYEPRSHARLFSLAGGALFAEVALGSRAVVRATAGLAAPLRRDAFEFRPDVFHRVAALALDLGLGVGARFP